LANAVCVIPIRSRKARTLCPVLFTFLNFLTWQIPFISHIYGIVAAKGANKGMVSEQAKSAFEAQENRMEPISASSWPTLETTLSPVSPSKHSAP
jgi:hypothetical protein